MKNRSYNHDFGITGSKVVGGYTLVCVQCHWCNETREVFAPVEEVNRTGGCIRPGPDEPWQRGDLLVRDGHYLDQFVQILDTGRVLTWNAGGHYHEANSSDLKAKI